MKLRALRLFVMLAILALPVSGAAQRPRFTVGEPIAIAAGDASPQAVAVGDLNGDARLDIAVVSAEEEAGPIALLINDGAGAFAAPRFVSDEEGIVAEPVALALTDLGSALGGPDGNLDIIVVDAGGGYAVLFGDSEGNFVFQGPRNQVADLDAPAAVAVGDFDGQNGVDLALTDTQGAGGGGQVFFLCNTGERGVVAACATATLNSGGAAPVDAGAGDFNGDNHVDVVVLNQGTVSGTGNVALFSGSGDGSFALATGRTFPVAAEPRDLVVADLNLADDTIDDVAVAEFEELGNDNVTILLGGMGPSVFTRPAKVLLELGTTAIAVGNLSRDPDPDLAGTNDVAVRPSEIAVAFAEDGSFQPALTGGPLPGGAIALITARLNDDELDDLVALSLDGTALRIALNTFEPATPTPSPTLTSLPTETPTSTATPTPSASATSTNVATPTPTATSSPTITPTAIIDPPMDDTPTPTHTATMSPRGEDDSCSIAVGSERSASRSWLPLMVGLLGIWLRRRRHR